ncbi:MAG: RsmB/NOP family class I SAM-dependent RNA methyltransferase [Zoogloeaceae bacterium]|nr:RsmB/NOP family class I SAM-dependent RNA methyltransferase [Zoogloeaceae bacterium]MCK6385832.1 RsmB/NOP family class I SAM-dependent RNA methyltransferase [Rhodocyclaceae bacterium]
MRITAKLIDAAATALGLLLKFDHPADAVLSKYFRDHRELGQRDRGFVAETAYAVLRRRRWLEKLLGAEASPRRLVLAALVKLSGVSQRQLEEALKERELKWVADLKGRQPGELSLAEQADFPDWLAERLLAHMEAGELLKLAQGLNQPAPLDLRVNPLKTGREDVLARLAGEGIAAEAGRLSPLAIRLKAKPALQQHPLYLDGTIEVQDEGSQLLGYLLAPKRGEMVADFCAGAGGKTLLLGALMRSTGRLYAFDVSDKRLARLKERVARAGLSNVHPVAIANENDLRVKRLAGKLDRVLVDAPCSGLGTLRRNPDLKWRQTPEGVAELVRKQRDILQGAARLVKPGGRLVYATCSILPEENEAIVAAFLAAHPEFKQMSAQDILGKQGIALECGETLRLMPHTHGTDGFFAAVLERVG